MLKDIGINAIKVEGRKKHENYVLKLLIITKIFFR